MPSDLTDVLHRAAPRPRRDLDPDELWASGRRRRRRRRVAAGLAAVVVAAGASAAAVRIADDRPGDVVAAGGDLVAYEDASRGLAVRYPSSWQRAETTLTPNLLDPIEVLTLGTADLPAGGESCAQFPEAALEAMGATDALVTVQERRSEGGGFPPRPERFPPPGSMNVSVVAECMAGPAPFDHWWIDFRDAGRDFYVLVAIGHAATDRTQAEAWAIVNSLEIDPTP